MTDYMNEAERLIATHESAIRQHDRGGEWDEGPAKTLSALLAHIQRGAVPDGWQVVPKAPTEEMLLSGMGDDWPEDVYLRDAYELMLSAAPAPDHFRDAAKMVAAPAEVPMPEPDVTTLYSYTDSTGEPRNLAHTHDQMQTYGAACRAAGEAAGYARGRAEAGRDAERYRTIRFLATAERDPLPEYAGDTSSPDAFGASIDHATAALRGEAMPYYTAQPGESATIRAQVAPGRWAEVPRRSEAQE